MAQRLGGPPPPPRPRPRRRGRPVRPGPWLGMLLAALAVRVAVLVWEHATASNVAGDPAFIDAARNLAQGAGLAVTGPEGPVATVSVPPLGPWLASVAVRRAGSVPVGPAIAGGLLGALIPLLAASLGGMLFGGGAGRVAGWIAVFDPVLVRAGARPATDAYAALFLIAAIAAAAAWVRTPRGGRAFGVGLLCGLGALAHPALLGVVALVAAWAWVPLGLTVLPRDRIRQVVLLAAGALLVVAPWAVRNAPLARAFVPVSAGGGIALRQGNQPAVWSDPALAGGAAAPLVTTAPAAEQVALDRAAGGRAWRFATSQAGAWPRIALAKVARFAAPPRDDHAPRRALAALADPVAAFAAVMLLLALAGAVVAISGSRRWFQAVVLAAIAYYLALALVFWGGPATRVPVEPLLAVFAAAGYEQLRRTLRVRSRGFKVVQGTT